MRKFKKFVTLLIALTMVLSFNIAAFADNPTVAAGNCAIDVTNLKTSGTAQTVKADLVYLYNEEQNAFVLQSKFSTSGLPAKISDSDTTLLATQITALSGTVTDDASPDASGTDTDLDGTVSLTGLSRGLYLVVATDPDGDITYNAMVAKTYTYNDTTHLITDAKSTIVAKYGTTNLEKSDNDANKAVYIGQQLTYTISDTIKPGTTSFVINDTLSGATYKEDWSLSIGGTPVTDYTLELGTDGQSFTLTINNSDGTYDGKQVVLTYTATVNEDAFSTDATGTVTNTVTDTNDSEGVTTTDYSTSIQMEKTDEDGNALTGAIFALKNEDGAYATLVSEGNGVYHISGWDADKTSVTEDDTNYIMDMSSVSSVTVKGVDDGTYTFVEIKAPAGYSINKTGGTATVTFTDSNANGIVDSASELVVTNATGDKAVKDTKISELPSTGGTGTILFTLAGCAVMIFFAASYFKSKKRNAQ